MGRLCSLMSVKNYWDNSASTSKSVGNMAIAAMNSCMLDRNHWSSITLHRP